MSDPAHDGYTCHGPLIAVELPHIYDGACAFLCLTCGTWRHRFSPGDERRAQVEFEMPAVIEAHIEGEKQ
tara:strand:- start:225 stop:434 length:210 start_codon:yes stop_codon:yes gene_type:complete